MPVQPNRVQQSKQELVVHIREQLGFLEASAFSYDAGVESEAKRLAVVLRPLLHDTSTSRSLLNSLSVKQSLEFHDVVGPVAESSKVHFTGLAIGFTPNGSKYYPRPHLPQRRLPFDVWWKGIVLLAWGATLTRKKAVLALANTDGGAHVDPALGRLYAAFSRNNAMGWQVATIGGSQPGPGVIENSPALPVVRQIAHEVIHTFREQLPPLLN